MNQPPNSFAARLLRAIDRLTGGRIVIQKQQRVKTDPSFTVKGAVMVRFINNGQNYLRIDQQEVIPPGEAYVEGDLRGPGIDHRYLLEFIDNPTKPTANPPIVYAGNHLDIRIMKREYQ